MSKRSSRMFPAIALFTNCLAITSYFVRIRRFPCSWIGTFELSCRTNSDSKSGDFFGRPNGFPENPFLN